MKNLLKNMIPYVLISTVTTFFIGIRYSLYFAIGMLFFFILYYISLKTLNGMNVKDKRVGNTNITAKMFLINVLITYGFYFMPIVIWLIINHFYKLPT